MNDQLSAHDVTRMYREGRHDEIDMARKDGRLAELLGVPDQQSPPERHRTRTVWSPSDAVRACCRSGGFHPTT